jgi:hypothetical protein
MVNKYNQLDIYLVVVDTLVIPTLYLIKGVFIMLTNERYFKSGFTDGYKGRAFNPPTENYGKAYYLAGFNVARNENIFKCASEADKQIITSSIEGLTGLQEELYIN